MSTETLRPNALGDETEITAQWPLSGAHWDKVDEVIEDEDATYVYISPSVIEQLSDLYNLPNHTASGTINHVKVYVRCRNAIGYGFCAPRIKTGGIGYTGTATNLTGSYVTYSEQWDTNPATGTTWTWDEIDALQAGVWLYNNFSSDAVYCTQVYVEVDCTPGIVVTPPTLLMAITTYAPTVITEGAIVVTPPTLALTLTTYAPKIIIAGLSTTLEAEQQEMSYTPVVKFTFSHGEDEYTYDTDRLLSVSHKEAHSSHKAELLLNDSDGVLLALDLKGYQVKPEWGFVTSEGDEVSETAPLWVKDQHALSSPGILRCYLSCFGIPDRLAEDKASDDHTLPSGSTKTVKDLITEVADGQPVTDEDVEEQTIFSNWVILNQDNNRAMVGQKLPNPARTITGLAFYLKKTGSGGSSANVTFEIVRVFDETVMASTTFPVSNITTGGGWCKADLSTPLAVNYPIYIWAKHINTEWLNYVEVAYSTSDVKAGEHVGYMPWVGYLTEVVQNDCAYRYYFQAGGLDVFSHCQAWDVVYDSEDSLIDTYQPKDSLSIRSGESRLNVIDKLLYYTGCERMFKADGKIHILVPTTTGEVYDYEYQRTGGHTFFDKQTRDGLVIPNKITVQSREGDAGAHGGSATSATSYALMPVDGAPIRTLLSSNAQAQAMAEAYISRLEVASQRGSATVPMNVGAELWDYVKITDDRAGDSVVGNIGYLERRYNPFNNVYELSFGFGGVAVKGVPGTYLAELQGIAFRQAWMEREEPEEPPFLRKDYFVNIYDPMIRAFLLDILKDLTEHKVRIEYLEAQE